jgi:hypothetical protein
MDYDAEQRDELEALEAILGEDAVQGGPSLHLQTPDLAAQRFQLIQLQLCAPWGLNVLSIA